jgi:hypothetical protein
MTLSGLNDHEMRDILSKAATNIEKAVHFTRTLADVFVYFPQDHDARAQLIDSSLTIQAAIASQLDSMRIALENCDRATLVPEMAELD